MRQNKYIVIVLSLVPSILVNQTQILPLDHSFNNRIRSSLFMRGEPFHTSIQPYELRDVYKGTVLDSVFRRGEGYYSNETGWSGRKLFQEHLIEYSNDEYSLYADFLPDVQIGYDFHNNRNSTLNTRGFIVGGSVQKSFSFYSEFYESQAKFPGYIDSFIDSNSVVPGQGFIRFFGPNAFDYSYSSALVSYRPSQFFGIVAGHGKNFVGNGYRSLLLSDISFNYPYIKLTADIWRIKYFVMWSEFQNILTTPGKESFDTQKKYGVFHYLDIHVTNEFTLGLFEGIVWAPKDSTSSLGFDWNYLNPIIFLRPVDFSIGSPGNVVLGLNTNYKISNQTLLYGQFLIDEFTANEFISDKGYWGNKYAVQFGVQSFFPFSIKRLFLQGEFNTGSPYTYSEKSVLINYGHYQQPLAHPLGANFYEGIGIVEYSKNRYEFRIQLNYSIVGTDSSLHSSVGENIYRSYDTRNADYGNYIGQGEKNKIFYSNLQIAYILNPLTNLRIELSSTYRSMISDVNPSQTLWFGFGIRSSFRNLYYDF